MGHQDLNTFVKRFKGRFSFLARVSDISAFGTNRGNCPTGGFWLIVVTERNEDETENHEHKGVTKGRETNMRRRINPDEPY